MSAGKNEVKAGHLYVVATPIGNLADLSPRALKILDGVSRICAEDTRTTGAMLAQFGVRTALVALHDHNEDALAEQLIQSLRNGDSLALVSDAGTPLISDPGFALVRAARAAQLPVIALPGPCAAVAALSVSGIATDRFVFEGFLPAKSQARRKRLQELADETRTLVFYESSHRVAECVEDFVAVLGPARMLCLARELTKLYEDSITAPAADIAAWIKADAHRERGEFVLVCAGAEANTPSGNGEQVLRILLRELGAAQSAKLAAEISGQRKNELYELALELKAQGAP